MIRDVGEDEEKWLAEGIAGVQQNAFFMHRALVFLFFSNYLLLQFDLPVVESPKYTLFVSLENLRENKIIC